MKLQNKTKEIDLEKLRKLAKEIKRYTKEEKKKRLEYLYDDLSARAGQKTSR